jgi:two-component system cell cycle sensor histidine kinase/response regulator CckA
MSKRIVKNFSIRSKQMFIIMLTSSVVLLIACAAFVANDVATFRRELPEEISTLAGVLGHDSFAALDSNDPKSATNTLGDLRADPDAIAACIYNRDGKMFAVYHRDKASPMSIPPHIQAAGYEFVNHQLQVFRPITEQGENIGTIFIAFDLTELTDRLMRYAGIAGFVFVISLMIAFALSSRLQRLVSGPILQLAQVAHAVALDKNYSVRATKRSNDELGQLVDGFNEMLTQIQARDADLQIARTSLEQRVEERTKELSESLSLLKATIDSTADGIVAVDLAGKIISYNTKFADLWQFPAGMLERRNSMETRAYAAKFVKYPEPFLRPSIELQNASHRESFDVVELKDGRTFERYVFPQMIDGRRAGAVVNYRDVTERKRAEMELRWNSAFLKAQITSAIDGMLVVNSSGIKVFQNRRLAELLKIPPEITNDSDAASQIQFVKGRAKNPAQFAERVAYLYAHPDEISHDEIHFVDDTILDRYSYPVIGQDGTRYGRIWVFRDITERLRIEEELKQAKVDAVVRESAQRYNFLAEAMPLILWTSPPDGALDYYNRAWFDYTGLTLEQTQGWGWGAVIHPDDLQRCIDRWQHSFTTGEEYEIEYRFKRADGIYRWFLGRALPRRDAARKIVQWVGTATDIDDQKRAEEKLERTVAERTVELVTTNEDLEQQQTELRVLFDLMPAMIWFKDTKNGILRVNQRVADAAGKSIAEIEGKPSLEIYPVEAAKFYADDLEVIQSGAPKLGIVERIPGSEGKDIWVETGKVPVCDKDGKVFGIVVMAQDITPRMQAEESLRLLDSAIEQTKESIIITDAQLDLPGPKIIFINPAFTKLTGYNEEEAIGKTPRILQGPRTDKTVLSRLRQNLEAGKMFAGEAINYRKDGTEFNLEWQIAPLRNAKGTITHFVGIQRDITERKRLEAQLFQSQKIETVGKLAGGIAHEFNSIMTAIIGQSELLLNDLPANDPLRKNATEISKAADRAAVLTRQLLAYGRKQILQPQILDLNSVLTGMETVLRHLMGRNIDVRIIANAGLKMVKVDAGQIEQVIVNIVMNAAEAMPNGGKLTLETANVTFDADYVSHVPDLKAGEYVMLAITDTGAGMSEEVKARLFEPFFSTKGVGRGTGLGLATCYGIIKQSSGHIKVYSEPGRGATFKIYLPQVEQLTKPLAQRLDASNMPRGIENILLVEDDPALREMAATLLGRLGYSVLAAANGIEALGLIHQPGRRHIDLLFTDVVMPHMSGKELADRIRSLYPHTKILFTSAYTENAIVHQGVLDEGVALLQKPFTPSALAQKIRGILDAEK